MAEEAKTSFPKIPAKNWFTLRKKFRQALPGQVTTDYLQSVLAIESGSAKNLMPNLKTVGLIDDNGKLTDLAHEWRADESYSASCSRMFDEVYPEGLRAAFPPPVTDRRGLTNWFARNAKVGEAASSQFAAFYLLLANPDPSNEPKVSTATAKQAKTTKPSSGRSASPRTRTEEIQQVDGKHGQGMSKPSLHLTLQVHIAAGVTTEQIDQVFASMSKHLYGN